MGGKNWYYDTYDLRKYNADFAGTFIDIGANVGSVSMLARLLMPKTRIIAIEPCKKVYEELENRIFCWGNNVIEAHNFALGDGSTVYLKERHQHGLNRFVTGEEAVIHSIEKDQPVPSKTLKQIFDDLKIDRKIPYIVKIDTEGGERFIRWQGEEALDILKGATQVSMELHLPFGGTGEEWDEFFKKFFDTHVLKLGDFNLPKRRKNGDMETKRKFRYTTIYKFEEVKGWHEIQLIKR
tara:strand:+ start:1634 stop:2347 length:714 start_codon:yes stop_codon:yes gene_type:complete